MDDGKYVRHETKNPTSRSRRGEIKVANLWVLHAIKTLFRILRNALEDEPVSGCV